MNKAVKKFRIYAIILMFVMLTALLAVINCMGFTMAAEDEDELTKMIADHGGVMGVPPEQSTQPQTWQFGQGGARMGPMGPDSPEITSSLRYFTAVLNEDGNAELAAFNISAVSQSEAIQWARSLMNESAGWTRGTYRYRVYERKGKTFVTVIDQGRELLPSYRILIISACGEVLALIISWAVLLYVGRRLYAPVEEADRKQKRFIANAEKDFRLPLTVISANTELIERSGGPDDQTRSIRRQVAGMRELVEKLAALAIFTDENREKATVPLSEYLRSELEQKAERFAARGIALDSQIAPDVTISADADALHHVLSELTDNALKYSLTRCGFSLTREGERIILETRNDTSLPDGSADQVFDRFTTLSNAPEGAGAGLGLSYVKDAILAMDGRVSAKIQNGEFILRLAL